MTNDKPSYRIMPRVKLQNLPEEEVQELYNDGIISKITYLNKLQLDKPVGLKESLDYACAIAL